MSNLAFDQLFKVFVAAQKIADISFNFWDVGIGSSAWIEDKREEVVNPACNVTKSGLFLEMNTLKPGCIWTPWGDWTPWGAGVDDRTLTEKFLSEFTLSVFEPALPKQVYKVEKVEEEILPTAVLIVCANQYPDYNQAMQQWKELKKRYQAI